MNNLNLNLPADVVWAPWIILALVLVCATAVIIFTVLRPTKETGKLQQTIISVVVSLFAAVGGYLVRTPEIQEKEYYLENRSRCSLPPKDHPTSQPRSLRELSCFSHQQRPRPYEVDFLLLLYRDSEADYNSHRSIFNFPL